MVDLSNELLKKLRAFIVISFSIKKKSKLFVNFCIHYWTIIVEAHVI